MLAVIETECIKSRNMGSAAAHYTLCHQEAHCLWLYDLFQADPLLTGGVPATRTAEEAPNPS